MTGSTVAQFEIAEQLGSGGMGVVYRARDTRLDRDVALKFLPPLMSSDPEAKKRFMQEAKAASGLDHPNICTIFDIGETDDGRLFIAMAYYDGTTLKYHTGSGALDAKEALSIGRQIAQGLQAAHAAGIVHRDIKPANIMVTASGRVKILDFGVAKLEEGSELTKMGSTVGTAAYMSPEQAKGGIVDGRSDLWSLGVVMYEMLAGSKPFDAGYDQALLYSILNESPEDISTKSEDLPERAAALIMQLLEKDAASRPESAAEVSDRLAEFAGTGTRTSYTSQRPSPEVARSAKKLPIIVLAGVTLAAVFAFLVWLVPFGSESTGTSADINTIAVFPFTINGDESLQYLDEGMISLLGTKLDGTDDLRTVDKTALIGMVNTQVEGVVTPEKAWDISNELNAGSFVLGSVTKLADLIQLDASLYSSEDTVRVQVMANGEANLAAALDELAIALVTNRLTEDGSSQLRSVAAVTTDNFEALKAFLEAEKLFRAHETDEAYEAYLRAVKADSTFSLAWYRLSKAIRWNGGEFNLSQRMKARRDALDKALTYRSKMPSNYRNLIDAADAFEKGDVTRAQDLYRRQLERYPNQVETLLELADLLISYNPLYGRPALEAKPYLERVLAVEPDNNEANDMIWELSVQNHDTTRVRELLGPEEDFDTWEQTFSTLYFESDQEVDVISALDSLDTPRARMGMAWWAGIVAKNPEMADRILLTIDVDTVSQDMRNGARLWRQGVASSRGQVAKADSIGKEIGTYWAEGLIDRVMRSVVPMFDPSEEELFELKEQVLAWDTTNQYVSPHSVNEGHYGEIRALMLGSLAARLGDDTELETQISYLANKPDAETPGEPSFVFAKTLRAVRAWYLKENDQVLAELENSQMFTNDVCAVCSRVHAQTINRFMRAEILFSRGEYDDALKWYNSLWDGNLTWGSDHLGTTYLRTAAVHEERGESELAAQYYAKFIDLWKESDPKYQGLVDQARQREQQIRTGQFAEDDQLIIPVQPSN